MTENKKVTGSIQTKVTARGKEYLYTVIYVPSLGKPVWKATGLEAKGNIRKAQLILSKRIKEIEEEEEREENKKIKENKEIKKEPVAQEKEEPPQSVVAPLLSKGSEILFVDWMKDCLECVGTTVRGVTKEGYDNRAKHIYRYFTPLKLTLDQVTAAHIDNFVQYLLKYGKTDKKTGEKSGLAIRTVRSIKSPIVTAYDKAMTRGYVKENPARAVKVGKRSNNFYMRKLKFFTLPELNDFLDYVKEIDDSMQDIIRVIAYYGLRRSEALGLYIGPDSIDLKNRRLHITRTIVKENTVHDEDETKSPSSTREFYITDEMYEFFCRVIRKREEAKKFYGNTYIENKSLFTWEDGKSFEPDFLYHHFKIIATGYGRPNFTLHNLRHSCASYLVALGWDPKDIASWIGHSDFATTMKWYVVIQQAYMQEKAKKLDGQLNIL